MPVRDAPFLPAIFNANHPISSLLLLPLASPSRAASLGPKPSPLAIPALLGPPLPCLPPPVPPPPPRAGGAAAARRSPQLSRHAEMRLETNRSKLGLYQTPSPGEENMLKANLRPTGHVRSRWVKRENRLGRAEKHRGHRGNEFGGQGLAGRPERPARGRPDWEEAHLRLQVLE